MKYHLLNMKLITPLQYDGAKITYEEITLFDVEFLSNDLAIQAGRE